MKSMAETIRFVLCALFTLGGLFILITGVVGVYRFHYALNILLMLIGVMIAEGLDIATLKMLFVILTLWLTSPVSSHLIGRLEITINDGLENHMNVVDKTTVAKEKEGL